MKKQQPTLTTGRLILHPFTLMDVEDVQCLAGAREIAATTLNIPHPYPAEAAENWIISGFLEYESGSAVTFAISLSESYELIGAISLTGLSHEHNRGELGYWIGVPYWGKGYCTEAAQEMIRYGFDIMGLNRIFANCFKTNPSSSRVMQKIGMVYEGCMRQHVKKYNDFLDVEFYGMLRSEWEKSGHDSTD